VKVRIAVGLGATGLDADVFTAVVGALRPLGFDSLWVSEVLTGPGPDPLLALATAAQLDPDLKLVAHCCCPDATNCAWPRHWPASTCSPAGGYCSPSSRG